MSNMHSRIMNMPPGMVPQERDRASDYMLGHRDASHSAAKIASEGDALIADLLAALEALYAVTPHTPPAFGPAWREQHMAALAMAEAAIARAKGEA